MSYMTTAVVVAAGSSSRMKSKKNKLFMELNKKPLITYCLDTFEKSEHIHDIVLVINRLDLLHIESDIIKKYGYKKIVQIVEGGNTRQESVYRGVMSCSACDIVLIHDAARPFIDDGLIKRAICDAHDFGGSVVGHPITNTVKYVDEDQFVLSTPNREMLWEVQTPQTFRIKLFKEASEYAKLNGITFTDDSSIMENFGLKVKLIKGNENNIKITTKKDLYVAKKILKSR